METGALARVLVAAGNGRAEIASSLAGLLTDVGLTMEKMPGVLGRLIARAVEADVVSRQASTWLADLRTNLAEGDLAVADITWWDPSSWRSETDGFSLGEGPRGTVGHWVGIRDGLITSYQVVDGSTWNASPRDDSGGVGPIEAALAGVTLADPARPIEALRVIHSFAPCGGCASHVFRPTEGTR
jgi:Ni,Fe-hydrogenase I large subunit